MREGKKPSKDWANPQAAAGERTQRTLGVALERLERRGLQKPCWEMSGPWFLKPGPFPGQMLPFGNAP